MRELGKVTPRTIPGAPTAPKATAVTGAINLVWTAPPSKGGAAITSYVVQYDSSSDTSWTTFSRTASATASASVTGLVRGRSYVFRVAAVNAAGIGTFAGLSAATVAK
jgi:hypothetical protein